MRKTFLCFFTIVGSLTSLIGCNKIVSANLDNFTQTSKNHLHKKNQINIPPNIKIDTSLLYASAKQHRVLGFLDRTRPLPDFSLLSIPQEEIVFQEIVENPSGLNESYVKNFLLNDTSKRYSIYISKSTNCDSATKISLNLNGHNLIRQKNFSQGNSDMSISGLIMNARNSVQLIFEGNEQCSITLTVREGGEAGTILRPSNGIRLEDATQATRLQNNEVNIFDPNNPDSLGGLTPYEGHLVDSSAPADISGVSIDGSPPLLFETGSLILQIKNPSHSLPFLKEKYGAIVKSVSEVPGLPHLTTHYIQFDLKKAPVQNLENLIQLYREDIPASFEDFTFASVDALQTFTILLDLLVNHQDIVHNWDLNQYSKLPLTPFEPGDWNNPAKVGATPVNNRGWWLRDTFVREAWNYSIGTNTQIAYIDMGFEGLITNNNTHAEIEKRRINIITPQSNCDGIPGWCVNPHNIPLYVYPDKVNPVPENPLECVDKIPGNNPGQTNYCSEKFHGVIPFELFNATILGIRSSERDYESQYSNRHPRKRRGAQTIAQTAA